MQVLEFGQQNTDTVMLLHGGGLSWWNYREAAKLLAERYHVVLPVLDGHADSDAPFTAIEENAAMTQEVVKVAKAFDVPVEAEIGELQRLDNGVVMENKNIADPEQVRQFLSLCNPDTLAIGIGNAHGYYKGKPDIKLEVLEAVRQFSDIPLVLHGCTGMEESIIKDAIKLGVAKINFGTEVRYKYVQHYEEALKTLNHQGHSWKLSQFACDALSEDIKNIIRLSGSEGKA